MLKLRVVTETEGSFKELFGKAPAGSEISLGQHPANGLGIGPDGPYISRGNGEVNKLFRISLDDGSEEFVKETATGLAINFVTYWPGHGFFFFRPNDELIMIVSRK